MAAGIPYEAIARAVGPRGLGSAASRDAYRGPAAAAGNGEAAHQADGGVGRAEGEQLPVRADLLTAPGERAAGQHVIAEGDDEHAEGRQRQLAESGRAQG